jgi:hypothetical protein
MSVETSDTRKPTHRAYYVRGEGEATRWLELGALWTHKDGKCCDVVLDALPVGGFTGRITVRANEASAKSAG